MIYIIFDSLKFALRLEFEKGENNMEATFSLYTVSYNNIYIRPVFSLLIVLEALVHSLKRGCNAM